ncbi:MAG: GNAT family N-acetyltransferase [Kofleriaceae bacterium]
MIDLAPALAPSRLATARGGARGVAPSVRRAAASELGEVARLVNRAHAVERSFVEGERVSAAQLAAMRERGHFLVLDDDDGALVAAVYVAMAPDDAGDGGTMALLSVAPERQGEGLGRRLLAVAEALCAAVGCGSIELEFVSLRPELGAWYRSQGYAEVGTAGLEGRRALKPCHVVRMQKPLA